MSGLTFEYTHHANERQALRDITREQIECKVRDGTQINVPARGIHGGLIRKFYRHFGSRKIWVIAEIRAKTCYVLTSYDEHDAN